MLLLLRGQQLKDVPCIYLKILSSNELVHGKSRALLCHTDVLMFFPYFFQHETGLRAGWHMPSSITKPQSQPLTFIHSNSLYECNEHDYRAFNCLRPCTRNSAYMGTMRCQKGNSTCFWNKNDFYNCLVCITSVNFLHVAKMLKRVAFCGLNSNGVWQDIIKQSFVQAVGKMSVEQPTQLPRANTG